MDAGRLDRRVTLQRAVVTVDAYNEEVPTWTSYATVWAACEPVSDGERQRAGETLSDKKARFTIRYSTDVKAVDARDLLLFEGRAYDVNGVKEIGRREFLEITATARAETP